MRIENVITEREIKSEDTLPTYVLTTKFNIDKVGLRVEIKNNKTDEYEPFDNIKKSLLNVVKKRQDNWGVIKSSWRYEFVDLILKLYTEAVAECDWWAYKVEIYEAVDQIGKYIDKNKKKIETLNRIKEENKELEKNIKEIKNIVGEKNKVLEDIKVIPTVEEEKKVVVEEEPKKKRVTRTKKNVEDTTVYDKKDTSRRSWILLTPKTK